MPSRNLHATRLSYGYRVDLQKGWLAVSAHVVRLGRKVDWKTLSVKDANDILVDFVQFIYRSRGNKGFREAKHGVLAVQSYFPRFRKQLREAWETVGSWEQEIPATLRSAATIEVLLAMSILARYWPFRATVLMHACGLVSV